MKRKESEKKAKDEEVEEEKNEEEAEEEDEAEPVVAETDNVGDPSVEINVEALIHELEEFGD
jgi:hypothetical protein